MVFIFVSHNRFSKKDFSTVYFFLSIFMVSAAMLNDINVANPLIAKTVIIRKINNFVFTLFSPLLKYEVSI